MMTLHDVGMLALAYLIVIASSVYLLDHVKAVVPDISRERLNINSAVCCGFEDVIADCIWFKAMYASEDAQALVYAVEMITTLDPHYLSAYRLGALSLIACYKRYDLALFLLEKSKASPLYVHDSRLAIYASALEKMVAKDSYRA